MVLSRVVDTDSIGIDLENFDLDKYNSFYFVGIGGISMSSLAIILKRHGKTVKGYDRGRSDATATVESEGIEVFYETAYEHSEGAEIAVYTAAVTDSHPEMVILKERGIPILKRAELLGIIAKKYRNSVAVAGTHGKSTTSGMLSHIFLADEERDPTILIGAKLAESGSAFRLGGDRDLIFEACEYKDSFLSFYPTVSVLLNVRLDHTDYFDSIERMKQSFKHFVGNTAKDGITVYNADCANASECALGFEGRRLGFSVKDSSADYFADEISFESGFASYVLCCGGKRLCTVKLNVPGKHNVENSLAAFAVAHSLGIGLEAIVKGLASFNGVRRRFELRGRVNGVPVYDDYAHHPDEIKATLAAAKKMSFKRVISVFQPHTYSRLHDLFEDFAASFGDSDLKLFTEVFSAREVNVYGISSESLAQAVGGRFFSDFEALTAFLKGEIKEGDLLVFMGAGDVNKGIPLILNAF